MRSNVTNKEIMEYVAFGTEVVEIYTDGTEYVIMDCMNSIKAEEYARNMNTRMQEKKD